MTVLFLYASKQLLESKRSELILGYLDDVATGGEAVRVRFDGLSSPSGIGEKVSLELNR
jgi:hypothetical protein